MMLLVIMIDKYLMNTDRCSYEIFAKGCTSTYSAYRLSILGISWTLIFLLMFTNISRWPLRQ